MGTLIDATLIGALPSTKKQDRAREPDIHQAKKGARQHFGVKEHIGADLDS